VTLVKIDNAKLDKLCADKVRKERDALLASTDWTQVFDSPVNKDSYAVYRQALRDIPQQNGFPHNVTWPSL